VDILDDFPEVAVRVVRVEGRDEFDWAGNIIWFGC